MIEKVFHLMRAEITDTNMASLAAHEKTFHGTPCLEVVDILVTGIISDRPVHMIKIQVVKSEFTERFIDAFFYFIVAVSPSA